MSHKGLWGKLQVVTQKSKNSSTPKSIPCISILYDYCLKANILIRVTAK